MEYHQRSKLRMPCQSASERKLSSKVSGVQNKRGGKEKDIVETSDTAKRSKEDNPQNNIAVRDVIKPEALPADYEISKYDVVCGRGKSSYERPGNRRFLDIVNNYVIPYRSSTQKKRKAVVLSTIVNEVRMGDGSGNSVGRFVKEMADGSWWEIGDTVAREKAGQAMRVAVRMRSEENDDGLYIDDSNTNESLHPNKRARLHGGMHVDGEGIASIGHQYEETRIRGMNKNTSDKVRAVMNSYHAAKNTAPEEAAASLHTGRNTVFTRQQDGSVPSTSERNPLILATAANPADLSGVHNGTQALSSLRGGTEMPALGRLWLVVENTWKPGSSDDSGIVWVGRTVKFIFPNETKNAAAVAASMSTVPTVTVTEGQRLMKGQYY